MLSAFKRKKPEATPSGGLVGNAQPCPFCGQPDIVHTYTKADKKHYIGCFPCRAFVVTESRQACIDTWNKRTA